MSKKKLKWSDPVLVDLSSTANGALLCDSGSAATECGAFGSNAAVLCDTGTVGDGPPPP